MAKKKGAQTVEVIPGRRIVLSAGVGRTNIDELVWLTNTVLADASDPISIVLGEGKENEKSNTSLVIAKHSGGKIGVIGPKRMSYENVIPSIAYFAQKLGDIINKAINDME